MNNLFMFGSLNMQGRACFLAGLITVGGFGAPRFASTRPVWKHQFSPNKSLIIIVRVSSAFSLTNLLTEPLWLVVQMTPVFLGPLAHAPEGKHDDAPVAAAHVEMEVGNRHGLQLRWVWSSRTLWALKRGARLAEMESEVATDCNSDGHGAHVRWGNAR